MTFAKELKKISTPYSVLLVEDDEPLSNSIKEFLVNFFDSVALAKNGEDALEKYHNHYSTYQKHFDIIITDIRMPKKNGIELSRELFKHNPKQKIIVISAHDDRKHLIDLINLGVDGFLPKPFVVDEICNILYDVCAELLQERKRFRYINLGYETKWDKELKTLSYANSVIKLTEKERLLLELLIRHKDQKFSSIEIFDYLYYDDPDKHFSQDTIKSLIKRLRKKIPEGIIMNTPNSGYHLSSILLES